MATANDSTAPDWLKEDSEHDLNAPLSSSQPSNASLGKKQTIFWIMKICTIALSGLMGVTAIIGLLNVRGIEDIGKVFVGVYMLVFSSILCSFEIIQVLPWEQLDFLYRRNFGFLYGAKGKSFFIIFIAFLSFGLGEPATLCIATGICLAAFGGGQLGLYLKYPDFFDE